MNEKSRGYKVILKWLAIVVFCIIELYFIHQRTCKYTYKKQQLLQLSFKKVTPVEYMSRLLIPDH